MISAAPLVIVAVCSWNNPGINPFSGQVPDTVYSYADIPKPIQDRLYERMKRRDYDDIALIGTETITGAHTYSDLRQMHFGNGKRCESVDRSKWSGRMERGLIYCEDEHCLIVPTVCRNVSRVTRVMTAPKHVDRLERNFQAEEEERLRELLKKQEEEQQYQVMRTVPEPSTLALAFGGLLLVLGLRRK